MGDENGNCIKIFGLLVEKKTNFTALVALILSIGAVAQGAYFFFQASKLTLIQPDRVMLIKHKCFTKYSVIAIVMPIAVINKTKSENRSLLKDVEIAIPLDKNYLYDSESYVTRSEPLPGKRGLIGCDKDESLRYAVEFRKSASFELIQGGAALSETIMFIPTAPNCKKGGDDCYRRNHLVFDDAMTLLEKRYGSHGALPLAVRIKYDDGKSDKKLCTVDLNMDVLEALKNFSYIDVACAEAQQ